MKKIRLRPHRLTIQERIDNIKELISESEYRNFSSQLIADYKKQLRELESQVMKGGKSENGKR